jgi:hypothetical protein
MRKTLTPLTAIALLALTAPAASAKTQTYKGKTSSGHTITIKVKRNKIRKIVGGVRMACIPIQGGGRPIGGSDVFGLKGTMPIKRFQTYSVMGKPAFHYREVTQKHDLWLKRRGKRITGRMRLQYSFLIPKYPIGTFTIYSCAGGAKFKAKRR